MANTITTIPGLGPDWQKLWSNGGFSNFQLDIVGFLAVLGEGSVLSNSQMSALSPLFYLPRILPQNDREGLSQSAHPLQRSERRRIGKNPTESSVQCSIYGVALHAFPDSGADANYISEAEVKRRKYTVGSHQSMEVKMANGQIARTKGTVVLPFSFKDEPSTYNLTFHIVKECVQNMIIGSRFLWQTKTLTTFRHRITRIWRDISKPRVRFMGGPQLRVIGLLDGRPACATPDTGADLSLVSESYARENGWIIRRRAEDHIRIQFADGSTGWTSGVVEDLPWEYISDLDQQHRADFYVYDGLETSLILGNELLEDSDAFAAHPDDFVWLDDVSAENDQGRLSIIKICSGREDGGRRLRNLFKRKRIDASQCVAATMNDQVDLSNMDISFQLDSLDDYGRAEREMLRRREWLMENLSASSPAEAADARREIDKWTEAWDLLVAYKPRAPSHAASPTAATTGVRISPTTRRTSSSAPPSSSGRPPSG